MELTGWQATDSGDKNKGALGKACSSTSHLWLTSGVSDMIQGGGRVMAQEVDKGMRKSKENGRKMKNSHVQRMEDRAPQGYGVGAKCFQGRGCIWGKQLSAP